MTKQELMMKIQIFLKKSGMKPTRFGQECMNDGKFYTNLLKGRSPTMGTVEKVLSFIKEKS